MALKQVRAPGGFEDTEAPVTQASPAAPAAAPAPARPAGTAVAVAPKSGLAVRSPLANFKVGGLYKDFKRDEPMAAFGTYPRLSGNSGRIQDKDGKIVAGSRIVVLLFSYNDYWMITPGVRDEQATPFVKYSNDGKVLNDSEQTVEDYLRQLKEEGGFEKANKKQYRAMWGLLLKVADGANEAARNLVGSIVEVSLAPTSRATFDAMDSQQQVDFAFRRRNSAYAQMLTIDASVETAKGNSWTKLVVKGTDDAVAEALSAQFAAPAEAEAEAA